MSMIQSDLLLGQEGGAGYTISRSLRFNSSDSAFCSRTFSSTGNRTSWTWSGWVKRSGLSSSSRQVLFGGYGANNDTDWFEFGFGHNSSVEPSDTIYWTQSSVSSYTAAVYRDTSAWYHIVATYDGSNLRFYVNNALVLTSAKTGNLGVNGAWLHTLGRSPNSGIRYFDGYLADVYFIDGQTLTPSSFVETSATTGQLIPKQYTGSFGTNGFWLKFSDNSAATATTLGKDYSGNNNNWNCNNLVVAAAPTYSASVYQGSSAIPFESGRGPTAMFDNSEATFCGTGSQGFYWDVLSSYNLSGTLEVLMENGGGDDGVAITGGVNNGQTLYQSGGSYINCGSISGVTRLTFVASTGAASTYCKAIKVGGVLLVDGSPASVDSLVDTPSSAGTDTGLGGQVAGNYCTLNPLNPTTVTLSNGNLDCVTNNAATHVRGTIGISSGKYYWECSASNLAGDLLVGICTPSAAFNTDLIGSNAWTYFSSNGNKYTSSGSSYGASWTTGDVIGVAFDADNGTLTFYKNGTSQGQAFSSLTSGPYFPAVSDGSSGASSTFSINFGQRPFAYTAPSGFKALCDTNLPAPVVAKPSTVFDINLSAATQATRTVSGFAFSPDLVISKNRTTSTNARWGFIDSVRGVNKTLASNLTDAEVTSQTDLLTAFNSDGFTLGADASAYGWNYNQGGNSQYVYYAFDAGTTTTTNTQGSITSSCRTSQSSGFSIVSYTGNGGSNVSVGHGLGIAPVLLIVKSRSTASDWDVTYTFGDGSYDFMSLNTTAAKLDITGRSAPTSTLFYVNGGLSNVNGTTYVAYAWAPVTGYSSFGSYTGNGSSDGPFQWCGFRPRWLLIKRTDTSGDPWIIRDAARDPYNSTTSAKLAPNESYEENNASYIGAATATLADFVSNGFKVRSTGNISNASGGTYVWAAFAESPFAYSRAR